MEQKTVKRPGDCTILIVDDEEIICEMLSDALEPVYKVKKCSLGSRALQLIDEYDFDVVITDLKIPDVSGLEVLEYAKRKDEFTEVIVITGYASLDSATLAINQGVYSYLLKPLQITEFMIQVEKAVASRLFHLRSIELMRKSDAFDPDVKMHVHEITSLYYFIRKLMLSLEIAEIMRITLDEANQRMQAVLSVISISIPGFQELYLMPAQGELYETNARELVERFREQVFMSPGVPQQEVLERLQPVLFRGKQGELPRLQKVTPVAVPMMITDRILGTLTVFIDTAAAPQEGQNQFLYVFSSIVSSVIDHGYIALQAKRQAKTDSLTGIANHRHFHETLDREIARAARKKGVFALVLLDIDNFKNVNDTYGHQIGDAVLVDMTRRIMAMVRGGDVLARYGGEEFGIILPDTDLEGAEILADRILKAISSQPFSFAQRDIRYTVSIGLAVYRGEDDVGKDRLIAAADRALYDSKENGKNRLSIGTIDL
ncbi:MAG: diguanylate cyclase [Chitinispirillaceae bacterium]|nr:diguanylate cyclase [Chitinispirillaceae bacterium]